MYEQKQYARKKESDDSVFCTFVSSLNDKTPRHPTVFELDSEIGIGTLVQMNIPIKYLKGQI